MRFNIRMLCQCSQQDQDIVIRIAMFALPHRDQAFPGKPGIAFVNVAVLDRVHPEPSVVLVNWISVRVPTMAFANDIHAQVF